MKKIYEFKGLGKDKKIELIKSYIKSEWKNLLLSYSFIILSSSKPIFSSRNGAIFVFLWFTLVVLVSIYAYVNQSDYMISKKKAVRYSKKHVNVEVEKGMQFFPEIGGWTFIWMQILVALFVYSIAIPISIYLQFKSFKVYEEDYMKLFIGIMADTYIVAFFNGILQMFIEFIYDCANDRTTLKKMLHILKPKYAICHIGAIIILFFAFTHYFNNEFEGLFGEIGRKIVGGFYIAYMIYPLFNCIKQVIRNKKRIH